MFKFAVILLNKNIMKKLLLLFVLFLSLSGSAQDEPVITLNFDKAVGERVQLTLEADGNIKIDGVQEMPEQGYKGYTLTDTEVKIYGNLTLFGAPYCGISKADVTAMPTLEVLDVFGNPIETIDVTKNTELQNLIIGGTQITELDITKSSNLEYLNINSCKIESLDLSASGAMSVILAKSAGFKSLDLTGAVNLQVLDCSYNDLGSIDLSKTPYLTQLSCAGNNLETLDITMLKLQVLNCNVNNLKTIDLKGQDELGEFGCMQNQITALDFTDCENLFGLMICRNKIGHHAMTELCASLNDVQGAAGYFTVIDNKYDDEGNVCSKTNVDIAEGKNWEVYDYDGENWEYQYGIPYDGIPDEEASIEETKMAEFIVHTALDGARVYVAGVEHGKIINIVDMQGRKVMSQTAAGDANIFDVSSLSHGVYVVSVGKQNVKFVVK